MLQLIVLYPQPADEKQFESDYVNHLALLHKKTRIPASLKPYIVTKFLPTPEGAPPFYQMFTLPFESSEAFRQLCLLQACRKWRQMPIGFLQVSHP